MAERDPTQRAVSERERVLHEELLRLHRELHPQATGPPRLHPDTRLDRELGLDSLARIELLARLEQRLGVVLREREGLAAATPAELLQALAGATPREAGVVLAAATELRAEALDLPDAARTLAEVLAWHAARHPQRLHVRFEGGDVDGAELSFGALQRAALQVAAGLQKLRIAPAEPVALMLPTHPDLLVAFFGVLLAGGVPVPLYPPARPADLADYWRRQAGILRNCMARVLIADAALLAHRHLIRGLTGPVEHVLTVKMLGTDAPAVEMPGMRADDLALLQYTSGSTADPKGVMLSHANILANLRAMGDVVGMSADDCFVSWLPLYHDMGLIGAWLGSLYYGTPLVLMPPQTFLLRPQRWLWAMHRYRATLSAAPNFALELCLHRIGDDELHGLDLRRWRLAFCGAEPVFPETLARFAARLAPFGLRGEALYPVYGLAENTLGLTFPPPGRATRVLRVDRDRLLEDAVAVPETDPAQASLDFVSCGLPLPDHEVRIVDEGDRELPDDRQGAVQFQGPSASRGYYRAEAATRGFLHGEWRDTGDLGFVHAGELYVTGRVKDLIIRAGRHLHPQAIEQRVGDLADVRRGRVAAFGTYAAPTGTERLVVVAETRLDDRAARDALQARIQAAVAEIAGEPADEVVLAAPGAILKTSSGKLRRAACRSAYEGGRLGVARRQLLVRVLLRGVAENLRRRMRRARALAYAGYAWALFGLMAVPAALATLARTGLPARWHAVRFLLEGLRRAVRVPLAIRMPAALPDGPCIFVANHASYVDVLLLVRALPRPVAFVAKAELQRRPLLGPLLARFGAVFVARLDPLRCIEVVHQAASGRRDFLFFPEGTFRRMPGLLPFHMGAFIAAADAGLPVVPVALVGTRALMRGDDWFPRRGALAVEFGAALRPRPGVEPWREALRLQAEARAFLLAHIGEPDAGAAGFVMPAGAL
ncbi:MAG: AMP-binding protein [Mizugakiibacter sp.]|uniref:AMP-binding protein n=1 Tax=Mizugakiibacter sp. TaxID=1972610 RepID=UPI0031C67309|nr:AMP-binding protein [Xanthomonadaceae bacterium]